jgi:hypothetical protein
VLVVDLLDGVELVGVAGHHAQSSIEEEVALAVPTAQPLLHPLADARQQDLRLLRTPFLFEHIDQLEDAQETLSLPIRTLSFGQHHAPCIADVGDGEFAELAPMLGVAQSWQEGNEAQEGVFGLELSCSQQS